MTYLYNFIVIALNYRDFEEWKLQNKWNYQEGDTPQSFTRNEIRYMSVMSDEHIRGRYINGVIETTRAKQNPQYGDIIHTIELKIS